jgi:hypothetical protein
MAQPPSYASLRGSPMTIVAAWLCHVSGDTRRAAGRARTGRCIAGNAPSTTDLFEFIRTTRSMRRLKPDPAPDTLGFDLMPRAC